MLLYDNNKNAFSILNKENKTQSLILSVVFKKIDKKQMMEKLIVASWYRIVHQIQIF